MKAIVLGASGAVGKELVKHLEICKEFSSILVITRRALNLTYSKVEEVIIDFDNPESYKDKIRGNVLFSAFGTTIKKAGSKEVQYKIDYHYQYNIAEAASKSNIEKYVLVSASGANSKSRIFYSKMKGELDRDVKQLGFKSLSILKPSIIDGERDENRLAESIALKLARGFKYIPYIKKYRPIKTSIIAKAMISLALKQDKYTELELDEIFSESNNFNPKEV